MKKNNHTPEDRKDPQDQEAPKGARPSNRLWLVQGDGEDASWTEISAFWPTKKKNGLSASLTQPLPFLDPNRPARLVLLPAEFKDGGRAKEAGR